MLRSILIIVFFATSQSGLSMHAQNLLLPSRYFTYKYAVNTQYEMDTFTDILYKCHFIGDTLKERIKKGTAQKKLNCFLDVLAQSENVQVFYNTTVVTDYKKDFLSKINRLMKLGPLKMLDSVWYEYFRDTLNKASYVRQWSGYKLCMRKGTTVVKERIYIPINNSGQFYKIHYVSDYDDYVIKAVNQFLSVIDAPHRIGVYSNPLFYHPVTNIMLDQDGKAFVFFNKTQLEFYKSNDFWDKYYRFRLFYAHFDNYNTNGKKTADLQHILNANMMWYYDESTKRSIIRKINESYFDDFDDVLNDAHINSGHFITHWGVYPEVYKDFVFSLDEDTKGKIKARVIYDTYPVCMGDSFDFKVEANKKVYSGRYACGKDLDYHFLKLMYDIAKDAMPERLMYVATADETNLFFIFLNETEKNYIVDYEVLDLYDLAHFK